MKKIIFSALFLTLCYAGSVSAQQATGNTQTTNATLSGISFKDAGNTHEFGSIPQGIPVTYSFTFTNTGKNPLILSAVTPSCGCTSPEWTKEPIAPGKSGVIKVTYNAQAMGSFTKTVTITSNAADSPAVLYIRGEVKAAQQASNAPAATPQTATTPKKN